MKIMHVIHKLDIGGAQTLVKNYMLNFDNKKNDAVLLCLNHEDSSPYEKELSNRGIRVIYAQDYSLFKRRKNGIAKHVPNVIPVATDPNILIINILNTNPITNPNIKLFKI